MAASSDRKTVVVFPGTFDPPTNGHLDVIRRASRLFDVLIVGVGENPEKAPLFVADDRVEMLRDLTRDMDNVSVEAYSGLTFDFAKQRGSTAVLKGIRDSTDLQSELVQANTNRIVGDVETFFLPTSDHLALTSSTLIKQIAALGGDLEILNRIVPASVAQRLKRKLS
jgi:pantetheine-phosphate adenylyltransferase